MKKFLFLLLLFFCTFRAEARMYPIEYINTEEGQVYSVGPIESDGYQFDMIVGKTPNGVFLRFSFTEPYKNLAREVGQKAYISLANNKRFSMDINRTIEGSNYCFIGSHIPDEVLPVFYSNDIDYITIDHYCVCLADISTSKIFNFVKNNKIRKEKYLFDLECSRNHVVSTQPYFPTKDLESKHRTLSNAPVKPHDHSKVKASGLSNAFRRLYPESHTISKSAKSPHVECNIKQLILYPWACINQDLDFIQIDEAIRTINSTFGTEFLPIIKGGGYTHENIIVLVDKNAENYLSADSYKKNNLYLKGHPVMRMCLMSGIACDNDLTHSNELMYTYSVRLSDSNIKEAKKFVKSFLKELNEMGFVKERQFSDEIWTFSRSHDHSLILSINRSSFYTPNEFEIEFKLTYRRKCCWPDN